MYFQGPKAKIAVGFFAASMAIVAGAGLYYSQQAKAAQLQKANDKLHMDSIDTHLKNILEPYYGPRTEHMLQIYTAMGLMPVLKERVAKQGIDQILPILNELLQKTLYAIRPQGTSSERTDFNDDDYFKSLKEKLSQIPTTTGMPPTLNVVELKKLLSELEPYVRPARGLEPDVVLIYGSSCPDSAQRLDFFFRQLRSRTIEVNSSTPLPIYLMSGDRPLKAKEDGLDIVQLLGEGANEQHMMNYLFERENKTDLPALQPIPTNSPKENGVRPTTAGTILSFIKDYKLKEKKKKIKIVAVSSEPFVRYQDLVLRRVLLENGITPDEVEITTIGPNIYAQQLAHPELLKTASAAIQLDGYPREIYEINKIEALKAKLKPTKGRYHAN